MVPLVDPQGRFLRGKTALPIGCDGRERPHLHRTNRKNISMTGEPVGGLFVSLFIKFSIAQIQDLNLNPMGQAAMPRCQLGDTLRSGPNEHSGITPFFLVFPFE